MLQKNSGNILRKMSAYPYKNKDFENTSNVLLEYINIRKLTVFHKLLIYALRSYYTGSYVISSGNTLEISMAVKFIFKITN